MSQIEAKIDAACQEIEAKVKQYEKDTLAFVDPDNIASHYMSLKVDEIARKSVEEIVVIYSSIKQYSIFLQREINKERAWLRWFESKADEYAAKFVAELQENHGNKYGWNERGLIARNQPELMQTINNHMRIIRMKIDRLYGMPDLLQKYADSINDMKFAKIHKERQDG